MFNLPESSLARPSEEKHDWRAYESSIIFNHFLQVLASHKQRAMARRMQSGRASRHSTCGDSATALTGKGLDLLRVQRCRTIIRLGLSVGERQRPSVERQPCRTQMAGRSKQLNVELTREPAACWRSAELTSA